MFYVELVRRAVEFLEAHGRATPCELAAHVFGGSAFTPLLASLQHERLTFDGSHWELARPAGELAILELLASGPNPRRHHVVELAARRGTARFHALLTSGKPVPKLLRKLGVPDASSTEGAFEDWLCAQEAAERLQAFLRGATVAGFGYVPEFLEQLLGPGWPAVDLLPLVRLTGFAARPDPTTLARHFGLSEPLSRRPLDMLPFSSALLELLQARFSLDELRSLGRPAPPQLPKLPAIAETPGVYVMSSNAGEALYVGKSINLKRRVGSYLRSPIALSRNLQDLMELTDRIEVVPVDTELEALLLEQQLIEGWRPAFNVQRRRRARKAYLRLPASEPFPRLTQVAEPAADGAIYFGPFRHTTAAARLKDLLADILRLRTCTRQLPSLRKPRPPCRKALSGECLAPCIPGPPPEPYSAEVELARTLLGAAPDEFRRLLRQVVRRRPPRAGKARRVKSKLRSLSA